MSKIEAILEHMEYDDICDLVEAIEYELENRLDELKKSTKKRYVYKAINDLAASAAETAGTSSYKDREDKKERKYWANRTQKRVKGLKRANRMEEKESLDELSNDTLYNYIEKSAKAIRPLQKRINKHSKKAHKSEHKSWTTKNKSDAAKHDRKAELHYKGFIKNSNKKVNRLRGIQRAGRKIADFEEEGY